MCAGTGTAPAAARDTGRAGPIVATWARLGSSPGAGIGRADERTGFECSGAAEPAGAVRVVAVMSLTPPCGGDARAVVFRCPRAVAARPGPPSGPRPGGEIAAPSPMAA